MNEKRTRRPARTSVAAILLLLTAGSLGACGTQSQAQSRAQSPAQAGPSVSGLVKHGHACTSSADAVERWAAAGADLPACVLAARARARAFARQHCAVSADAAERRGARHPGNICEV